MIINLLINLVLLIFGSLFVFLPEVTISSIPFIGDEVRAVLVTAIGYYNGFIDTFPYAETAFTIFLYVIIPFEVLLLVSKFFLGHRTPQNNAN